jgi:hypothetical protein
MWLLRRKQGISFEQFRDHYENSHAVLGQQYLGHLLLAYRRNYILPAPGIAGSPLLERVFTSKAWDYDCITEWELADEAALEGVFSLLANPAIGKLFHDDEEHFLDRGSVRLIRCDQRESDTANCAAPQLPIDSSVGGGNLWNT